MLAAISAPLTRPAASARLDELGAIDLVQLDYRPLPTPHPSPLQKVASAFPLWNAETIDASQTQDWDTFWAARPAGAGRLVPLQASGYDDAVRAARQLVLTTRPGFADGDKQALAVLHVGDGGWYAAPLGGVRFPGPGGGGAWLLRMGPYPGVQRPSVTSLVSELEAVVGGISVTDVRGKVGVPVSS